MTSSLPRFDGTSTSYDSSQLSAVLTRLVAQGQTSVLGSDDVAMMLVGPGTGLLLVDVSWPVGNKLYQQFAPVSDPTSQFGIRFTLGASSYSLAQALAACGHSGSVTSLAGVFMALYTGGSVPYLAAGQLVASQGAVLNTPAQLVSRPT